MTVTVQPFVPGTKSSLGKKPSLTTLLPPTTPQMPLSELERMMMRNVEPGSLEAHLLHEACVQKQLEMERAMPKATPQDDAAFERTKKHLQSLYGTKAK